MTADSGLLFRRKNVLRWIVVMVISPILKPTNLYFKWDNHMVCELYPSCKNKNLSKNSKVETDELHDLCGACGWAALVGIRRGDGGNDKGRNKAGQ